jgi:hypothetical protein
MLHMALERALSALECIGSVHQAGLVLQNQDDPVEIDRVLKAGAERAAEIADPVVEEVKKMVGFWRT